MTAPANQIPQEDVDEFGIEYFDDIAIQRPDTDREEQGIVRKTIERAGDSGLLGPVMINPQIRRQFLRTGARVGETLLGLPGDVREVTKMAGSWIGDRARSLLGKEPLTDEEKDYVEESLKPSDWDLLGRLIESFPTSSDLRNNVTRKYTGDWLEPQNKWEAFSDDVAQDFASLLIPVKGKVPFARSIGTALFANAGGEVAGAFLGEDAKNYTKLGLLFTGGLIGQNKGGVKKYINGLFNDMQAEVPEAARVSAKNLNRRLDSIERGLLKGDPGDASKQEAFKKIQAIKNKIKGGDIDVDELLELTKSTNESIFSKGELRRGENALYKIREALHDTTKVYGEENAAFKAKLEDANQAFAATETSRKVGKWVKKNIKPKDYIYGASALVGAETALGAWAGLPAVAATFASGTGIAATAFTAEVLKRVAKSPALQRYYLNTLNSSLKQNSAAFTKNIKLLNDGLSKDFAETPFETIEFDEEEDE
jgi:hypothetical protein